MSCQGCQKCGSVDAGVGGLELPCTHLLCIRCSRNIVDTEGRSYSLACPDANCKTPFSIAVADEPHERKQVAVKDEYKSEITVSKETIMPCSGKVMGMAIFERNLYVVCSDPGHVIFKYDISESGRASRAPVELSISKMTYPRGIACSESLGCLYITDWYTAFKGKLWRYSCTREQRVEDPVDVLDIQPFGVSVSRRNGEVLVTCATPIDIFHKRGWIYVYEPRENGLERTRVIELPGLEVPRHAVLTSSSLIFACHGWRTSIQSGVTSFQDQPVGPVNPVGVYGTRWNTRGDRFVMNRGFSMALDQSGLILAVDYYNHRILLLTEKLYLVRHLITSAIHPVRYIRHCCVDPSTGRIYVGQEDGKIIVFDGR